MQSYHKKLIPYVLDMASRGLILQKIAIKRPFLNEAERSIADYILADPSGSALLSVHDLARNTGTSDATIFRFCRSLGYSGFSPIREQLPNAAQAINQIPLVAVAGSDQWTNTVWTGISSLLNTAAMMQEETLSNAALAIARASAVNIAGMGAVSAPMTEILSFGFQRIGLPSFAWVDSRITKMPDSFINSSDVAIGISHSGTNVEVIRLLTTAKKNGAKTICITNYDTSPMAIHSDFILCTGIWEDTVQMLQLVPRMSQLLIFNVLIERVSRIRSEDPTQKPNLKADIAAN